MSRARTRSPGPGVLERRFTWSVAAETLAGAAVGCAISGLVVV
ncbi:hypothetical protein RI138_27640 [Streptomyces sp. C11-1]|uniref:Aquaporin family protein n=1 Tax=Streptomyces durocortorensis TaxID=2811104 RepID=A0ABY9W2B8_9ACTN|nr:hypothetical protein [Streptomyces durocortorensis]WNF30296.1 hypothetical protein RI138_27640 [Streptomyces durocortorensis]